MCIRDRRQSLCLRMPTSNLCHICLHLQFVSFTASSNAKVINPECLNQDFTNQSRLCFVVFYRLNLLLIIFWISWLYFYHFNNTPHLKCFYCPSAIAFPIVKFCNPSSIHKHMSIHHHHHLIQGLGIVYVRPHRFVVIIRLLTWGFRVQHTSLQRGYNRLVK